MESTEMINRYNQRDENPKLIGKYDSLYQKYMVREREFHYEKIIRNKFQSASGSLKFIEIGAGTGTNINLY